MAVLALGACSSAGAESEADNVEAENIVIYAVQLGPDWQDEPGAMVAHGERTVRALSSSAEAQQCFKPRQPQDYTAVANGDGFSNANTGAEVGNQVIFHRRSVNMIGERMLKADTA